MEKKKKISICIVEDYVLIRKSLIHILSKTKDFVITGDYETAEECLAEFAEKRADIVIMDLGLPGINGLEATSILKQKYPSTKVIILTSHENADEVLAALASGASAYCIKDVESSAIEIIVREVNKGAIWLHPNVADVAYMMAPKPNSTNFDNLYTKTGLDINLTEREKEVLKLIVQGKTNGEIAEEIIISSHTAKAHVGSILSKLAVSDRVQAAVKAVRSKIVD